MLKKLLFSFLIATTLLASVARLAPPANAQAGLSGDGPYYFQGVDQWYTKVFDTNNPTEIFGERYTMAQVNWIINAIITWPLTATQGPERSQCLILLILDGTITSECTDYISYTPTTPHFNGNSDTDNSLLALAGTIFQDRPFSGVTQTKHMLEKLASPAYAQEAGFGFDALGVVRDFWAISRNVAYSLLILATIILAFMIMFRVQLDPRTVITIQSAIPRVVIALILITFSYAIAGFLVDLMYVLIGFLALVLGMGDTVDTFNYMVTGWEGGGILTLFISYFIQFIGSLLLSIATPLSAIGDLFSDFSLGTLGGAAGGVGNAVILFFLALITIVVLFFVILIQMFRTFFLLFKTTAIIIIMTMLAPFAAVLGTIPGSGYNFGAWAKSFFANLLVFPTVGAMFLFANIFLDKAGAIIHDQLGLADWITFGLPSTYFDSINDFPPGFPPLLSTPAPALIYLGISVAFILFIHQAADIVKSLVMGTNFRPSIAGQGVLGTAQGTAQHQAAKFGKNVEASGLTVRGRNIAPAGSKRAKIITGLSGYKERL